MLLWVLASLVVIAACSRWGDSTDYFRQVEAEAAESARRLSAAISIVHRIKRGEYAHAQAHEIAGALGVVLENPSQFLNKEKTNTLRSVVSFLSTAVGGMETGNVPGLSQRGLVAIAGILIAPQLEDVLKALDVRPDLVRHIKACHSRLWHLPVSVRVRMIGCMMIAADLWGMEDSVTDTLLDVTASNYDFLIPNRTYLEWGMVGNRLAFDSVWLHIYALRVAANVGGDLSPVEVERLAHACGMAKDIQPEGTSSTQHALLILRDGAYGLITNYQSMLLHYEKHNLGELFVQGRARRLAFVHRLTFRHIDRAFPGVPLFGVLTSDNYAKFASILVAVSPNYTSDDYIRVATLFAVYLQSQMNDIDEGEHIPMRARLPSLIERKRLSLTKGAVALFFRNIARNVAAYLKTTPALAYVALRVAHEEYWRPLRVSRFGRAYAVPAQVLIRALRPESITGHDVAHFAHLMALVNGRPMLSFADVFEAVFARLAANAYVQSGVLPWLPISNPATELLRAAEVLGIDHPPASILGALIYVHLSHSASIAHVGLPANHTETQWAGTVAAAISTRFGIAETAGLLGVLAGIAFSGDASLAHVLAAYVAADRLVAARDGEALTSASVSLLHLPVVAATSLPSDPDMAETSQASPEGDVLDNSNSDLANVISEAQTSTVPYPTVTASILGSQHMDRNEESSEECSDRRSDRQDRETQRLNLSILQRNQSSSLSARMSSIFGRQRPQAAAILASAEGELYTQPESLSYAEMVADILVPMLNPVSLSEVALRLGRLGMDVRFSSEFTSTLGAYGQAAPRMDVVRALAAFLSRLWEFEVNYLQLLDAYHTAKRLIPKH